MKETIILVLAAVGGFTLLCTALLVLWAAWQCCKGHHHKYTEVPDD